MTMTALDALSRGATTDEALALFDSLPAVRSKDILGRWAGREVPTGHPMDGLLENSGWYGKQFDGPEDVHPLLFHDGNGGTYPVNPKLIPLSRVGMFPDVVVSRGRQIVATLRPLLKSTRPRARLRDIEHRGLVTAAMVYDDLPIIDVFRRVDDGTLLGVMDFRHRPQPYFFILTRDN